jgi:hypothetical protein
MATTDLLAARARRAYELGRLRQALRLAPAALFAAGLALACGRPAGLSCALGAALLLAVVGLSFRGQSAGRGVVPGLLAGVMPLALPLATRTLGFACFGHSCAALCLPACVAGGAAAGALVAWFAARERAGEASFIVAAATVAALAGCLGCTLAGVAGVLGLLAGTVLGGAPVLLAAHARR